MAKFNTINGAAEADQILDRHGIEAIIVDEALVALKIGPLRVAPGKGVLIISIQENWQPIIDGSITQKSD